jgi:hypothetical protein
MRTRHETHALGTGVKLDAHRRPSARTPRPRTRARSSPLLVVAG